MLDRSKFLSGIGAVILVGLLIFFSQTAFLKKIRSGIILAAKPVLVWGDRVSRSFGLISGSLPAEGEEVLEKDQRLRVLGAELAKLREDNERLKKALRFQEATGMTLMGGRVLLYLRELGKEFLLVQMSGIQGVEVRDWVIDANGLVVGRVKEILSEFIKVEIASNPGISFEAEVIPLNTKVVANSLGGRAFEINLLPKDSLIHPGDFIAVLGPRFSRLVLAEVADVDENNSAALKSAKAVLLARPEILEEVFVLVP